MKHKFRKLVALLLIFGIFYGRPQIARAEETLVDTIVDGDIYDAGYEISIEDDNIIEFRYNNKVLLKAQYEDENRIYKSGKQSSTYEYDNGLLTTENRDGVIITYYSVYDENFRGNRYTGYEINGEEFNYIYDSSQKIVGISNKEEVELAKYVYEGLHVIDILSFDGEEWVSNNDENFCGNYNKIRSYGAYYDDETGLYYSNGVYDDVKNGKIVGMLQNDAYLTDSNPFSSKIDSELMPLGYEEKDLEATIWSEALLKNSSFNAAKGDKYYNTASTVEIIARTIYGENTSRELDQRSIAWVMLNRYHFPGFPNDLRSIANPNEFLGMVSKIGTQAQNPSEYGWRNAVYLACLMLTDSSEGCWNVIAPKPKGISNQVYFRSSQKLGVSNGIFESGGKLYLYYSNGSKAITNACIPGRGTSTTINGLKSLASGMTNYNIFFYHN